MRPTREGRHTPLRSGLVTIGIGINPEVPTEDPEPPPDLTDGAEAFVPFLPPPEAGAVEDLNLAHGTDYDGGGDRAVTDPTFANDGDIDTHAGRASFFSPGTRTWWLEADLGIARDVDEIVIRGGQGNAGENDPSWDIEHSDDSSTWATAVGSYVWDGTTSPRTATLTLTSTATKRYWRIGQTVGGGFIFPLKVHTWEINGPSSVSPSNVIWVEAPSTIDQDDATFDYALDDSVDAASLAFWRATLTDSYFIASYTAKIGFETAGSVTVTLQGATESDYSDATTVEQTTITATGSYTSDDLAGSWSPTNVYQYWQLLIDAADGVRVFEVSLFGPATFTGDHGDLTGRDLADQHPADAVTVDTTGFDNSDATDVQELAADFDAAITAGGGGVFDTLGWFNVMDYGATGDGVADDTAEIQAAIDACAAAFGGTVYFPPGEYLVGGALQSTGTKNGQILLPTISTSDEQITIRLLGALRPPFAPAGPRPDATMGYSIIRSTLTGASGTAACFSGGNEVFGSKNNLEVYIENLLCLAPDNATFTFWNISSCQGGGVRDLMISMHSWSSATTPTNSNSYGIKLPQRGQSNYTYVEGLCVYIFYTGAKLGELTFMRGGIFAGNEYAIELPESPHPIPFVQMHQTGAVNGIKVTEGTATWPVSFGTIYYNAEHMDTPSGALRVTTADLYDPDDAGRGTVIWGNALNSGPIDSNFYVTGGANVITLEVGESPATVAALDDLTDVTLSSPAEDDDLRYNGSVWVNDARKWEALTDGEDVFVWEGDDLVYDWNT